MVRRHLDYIASFEFHARTKDRGFNREVARYIEQWSLKQNCDAAARHDLETFTRLTEVCRVIDGDVGHVKMADGTIQGIEGDRIRDPQGGTSGSGSDQWVQGVLVDKYGRAKRYAVWYRDKGSLKFDRTVSAENLSLIGYYDRFDQIRGVSPLSTALNPLRDVYENFDLALAKAKVTQLFALAVYREATDPLIEPVASPPLEEDEEPTEGTRYKFDFSKGPIFSEMDPGDRMEVVESAQPSTQFQNFTELVLQVALKALDIPFSFYNESFTNFFGSRAAWLHYQRSCRPKRLGLQANLTHHTAWRLGLAVADGDLTLPSGWEFSDLAFEWVPTGMPWWDPAKEINGDLAAVGAALDYPQRITKERGRGNWYDNVDHIADAIEYAKEKGVPLSFIAQFPTTVVEASA
jgi:capsid protein